MLTVSIELDAKYRWVEDEETYLEVCPACGLDRRGGDARCGCGQVFERKKRGFLVTRWDPAELEVHFPQVCPHCLGPIAKKVTLGNQQYTKALGMFGTSTHKGLSAPVCKRLRAPLLMYFTLVVVGFFFVVAGLMTLFRVMDGVPWVGLGVTLGLLALFCLVWRHYTWIRFAYFDHRSYRFKVRRADYAHQLARLNKGRVL